MKGLLLRSRYVCNGKFRARSTAAAATKRIEHAVRPFEEIPEVKGLPLIGPVLDYTSWRGFDITRLDKHWAERHRQYGDIYKEKIPGAGMNVYCKSSEDTETMFRSEGRTPNRPNLASLVQIKQSSNLPETLTSLNGEEWYKFRKIANSAMLVNKMIWKYTKQQKEVAEDLVKYIKRNIGKDGEVPDFGSVLKKWAFEVSGTFLFSKRLGLLSENPKSEALALADVVAIQLEFIANSLVGVNLWQYFRTKELKNLDKAVNDGIEIMKVIIDREKNFVVDKDTILYKLLNSEELTGDEKISMLYDVLGAAVESTAHAAAFMMYGLTLKQDVQEKLREDVMKLSEEDLESGRDVGNMEYVNAFLKETHRLFPLTHLHVRFYNKDIVLSGYNIPAGVRINNTSASTIARSPEYFSNPDELIPERWMNKENPPNKFSFIGPFGQGSRSCVGRRLAMQELHLLLIEVLKDYRVEYHHKPIQSVFRAISIPSEPPQFKFIPLRA